jgi:PAS domain S-box-containing protein
MQAARRPHELVPNAMPIDYNPWLVILSVGIAVLASYAALDLAARIAADAGSRKAEFWLLGGALAMGSGIWSMHFVGMLAWQAPIPISYEVSITLASLLLAVIASGFALYSVSRDALGWRRLIGAGLLMGVGIAGMHYVGMAGMQIVPRVRYDPGLVGLSIAIAILASMAALQMSFRLRGQTIRSAFWKKSGCALLMGSAIYGMHYIGMAAAIVAPGSICTAGPNNISNNWLAAAVAGFSFMFLAIALISSLIDAYYEDRLAKDQLIRSYAQRMQAIVETSYDAFIGIGPAGRITDWNVRAERMFGWSRADALGCDVADLIVPASRRDTHLHRLQASAADDDMHKRFESMLIDRDGKEFPAEVVLNTLRSGAEVEFFAFVHDITDRRRAEEDLLAANRHKDDFLAMLGHELRNPLAPISAAAELLRYASEGSERLRQTGAVIARQVDHMTQLVDDLLDVSRITRGLITIHSTAVDLRQAVNAAVEQMRGLVDEHAHRLQLQLPSRPACVAGDEKRLVQVIANLLSNAARYTPDGGDILLQVEVAPTHVTLRVRDNGIGLSPDLLPHVFELFMQGKRSSDRSQGGLGLGLALVKSLVGLHGGRVSAHSEGAGRGSEFIVTLPRLPDAASSADAQRAELAPATAPAPPLAALRVLVVDDNVDAANSLMLLLQAQGHIAFAEYGPYAGLTRAIAERPDVLLLDIGLPEMDGYELACRLRAQPETRDATLVAVTGYGQQKDREASLAAGFDYHFVKPVDNAKLSALLTRVRGAV